MKKNFSVIHYRSRKELEINARQREKFLFMMFDCGRDENIHLRLDHPFIIIVTLLNAL